MFWYCGQFASELHRINVQVKNVPNWDQHWCTYAQLHISETVDMSQLMSSQRTKRNWTSEAPQSWRNWCLDLPPSVRLVSKKKTILFDTQYLRWYEEHESKLVWRMVSDHSFNISSFLIQTPICLKHILLNAESLPHKINQRVLDQRHVPLSVNRCSLNSPVITAHIG